MNAVTNDTKITIGDVELWTRPFGQNKALISATEEGTKLYLYETHKKHPEHFEIFVDDEDFCKEDLEGAFSVIVDPEYVQMLIQPGTGRFGFRVAVPDEEDANG